MSALTTANGVGGQAGQIGTLGNIHRRCHSLYCARIDTEQTGGYREHEVVSEIVLPYILSKKESEFSRKAMSLVPGVGGAQTARGIAKNLYKRDRGTLGVNRKNAAKWLVVLAVTDNSAMAQMIIADLRGFKNPPGVPKQHSDKLAENMAEKIKSM